MRMNRAAAKYRVIVADQESEREYRERALYE